MMPGTKVPCSGRLSAPPLRALSSMKAQATVTRKKSGISRSYRAGDDGTAWVVDFEKDLRAGVFR